MLSFLKLIHIYFNSGECQYVSACKLGSHDRLFESRGVVICAAACSPNPESQRRPFEHGYEKDIKGHLPIVAIFPSNLQRKQYLTLEPRKKSLKKTLLF
jgi:hypothetical protein